MGENLKAIIPFQVSHNVISNVIFEAQTYYQTSEARS